jgi:hypothetical protein
MFLFEEYLLRNQIDVPYAKATHRSAVIYRNGVSWTILVLRYQDQGNHPGYFVARYMEPSGNRYDRNGNDCTGSTLRRVREDESIYWENYQTYLTNWAKSIRKTDIAANEIDARLAVWEVCLQCFDVLLTPYATSELFFNTINLDLPATERYKHIEHMIQLIRRDDRNKIHNHVLTRFWEDDMGELFCCGNYATWLVKLVERYGC